MVSGFSHYKYRYTINSSDILQRDFPSGTGFNGTPDYTIQSNAQGRLLGGQAEIIGDVNSDGYDDLFVSELYNQTNQVHTTLEQFG